MIKPLMARIKELENINEQHRILNGELRQQLSDKIQEVKMTEAENNKAKVRAWLLQAQAQLELCDDVEAEHSATYPDGDYELTLKIRFKAKEEQGI